MSRPHRSPPKPYTPKPPQLVETNDAVILSVDSPGGPAASIPRLKDPPTGAWWNALTRAWFIAGPGGVAVRLNPQPAPPVLAAGHVAVLPAVKIEM